MGRTSYQASWEKQFPWLQKVNSDIYRAYCKICCKSFKVDGSGVSQVKSHAKTHKEDSSNANQRTFEVTNGKVSFQPKRAMALSPEDQVTKAEILQAMHFASSNYSFASASDDGERFQMMFPDSQIARTYRQSETKLKYNIQYGIAPFIRKQLIYDINKCPFTFKFDETTTSQVKKQYDGYLQYWSSRENSIVNAYCGSLFVGHCTSDQLVEHYKEFIQNLDLDSNFLLHVGMDGPNVNLAFERKLQEHLQSQYDTSFLSLGTCSLHPVHTAFRNGMKALSFDIDGFLNDIHFFFKLSSARRQDYAELEVVTNVAAAYAMKHTETRWLSMKNVCVRVLEQWINLKEYFLKFLPKDKTSFRQVSSTKRYERIKDALEDDLTEAYIAFCAFSTQDFENFLIPFQSNKPMIHLLYPGMCKLVSDIMNKFMKKSVLSSSDACENISLDVTKSGNQKSLKLVDIGVKAKSLFANNIFGDDMLHKFRRECLQFFENSTHYLLTHLPFNVTVLKYAQYLHPEKRNLPGATSAISNLALKVSKVVQNRLNHVFEVQGAVSVETVCDQIRHQWMVYQNEDIPEHFFLSDENVPESNDARNRDFYWSCAYEQCGLHQPKKEQSNHKRIDDYWLQVSKIRGVDGTKKYPQLFSLVKCVLSLSHGNSAPERGFSINKTVLDSHGYCMKEKTIEALRFVKDELFRIGGVLKFNISQDLLMEVKGAHSKYVADLEEEKSLREAKKRKEKKASNVQEKRSLCNMIESDIKKCEVSLQAADEIICDANKDLQTALTATKLDRNVLCQAQSKIDIGIDRKRKLEESIAILKKKKSEI